MNKTLRYATINSFSTAVYIIIVVSLLHYFGTNFETSKTIIGPISALMLFVFSAAFTGMLVFGRPIMWYLDGKKKEALSLIFYTLGIFLVIMIFTFILLIAISVL